MFGLQQYVMVFCKEAPQWPLTYFSSEQIWALLFVYVFVIQLLDNITFIGNIM